MGYEYVIKLTDRDLRAFGQHPREPKSLDELLRSIPIFKSSVEGSYFYSAEEKADPKLFSNIAVDGNRLVFCSYRSEDYRAVVPYLFEHLMNICGHFEIEDA